MRNLGRRREIADRLQSDAVNTLLVGYPQAVHLEVAAALSLLTPRFPLRVASPDGRPFRVAEGFSLAADVPYGPAALEGVAVVVVPGGNCEAAVASPSLGEMLRRADERRLTIGGICHGALVLAWAGVLDARRCTHVCTPKYAPLPDFAPLLDFAGPHFAKSRFVDEAVVVDDHVVTAKPWAHLEFATTLAAVAGLIEPRETGAALRSLRGLGRRAERHGYRRWALLLDLVPGRAADEPLIRRHVAWLRGLEAAGRLVSAGPLSTAAGTPADHPAGLVVLLADDAADALQVAEGDPFVRAGVRTVEIRAWELSCEENNHLGMG